MKILITGGTGFIGQQLIHQRLLAGDEIYCLTRNPLKVESLFSSKVMSLAELPKKDELSVDAVINLAGEPILDKRWSEPRKQLLRESRIEFTQSLVEWMGQQTYKPKTFISGSAIGFYGSQSDEVLNEDSEAAPGFTHSLCADWEQSALDAERFGVRVCVIRTGIVLGHGGALAKMSLPFKLGLGGPIGAGRQWMSWIHIDDEVEIIEMLLTHEDYRGAFNLTAPEAVSNQAFSTLLGKTFRRPAFLPMPGFVMKLMLGEGAELLLEGQRVFPDKLVKMGYKFKYSHLDEAFDSIYHQT